ncbi:MAG TPA: GNAT family N-acetyltransferase [Bacteroidales bacterium]|jgi:diamine N-acetyltransferase
MTGPEIHLRALEPEDLDLLYDWENDPAIWHLGNTFTPFSRFLLEQYLLNAQNDIYTNKQLRLMIELNDPGDLTPAIGSIDLFDFDPFNRRAGVGILITNAQRRKGYASEALGLLKNYAFTLLDLHQLYCNIDAENNNSIALFNKHGFEKCGEKKDWLWHNEGWHNELLLQCIRTERP